MTQIIDDLDGTVLQTAETIAFSIDGGTYEIDLSETNAERLRLALAPYVAVARKQRSSRGGSRARKVTAGNRDLTEVRAWARENGYRVSDRGRVKAEVLVAFEASK